VARSAVPQLMWPGANGTSDTRFNSLRETDWTNGFPGVLTINEFRPQHPELCIISELQGIHGLTYSDRSFTW
jgi:hypothetical protein